MNKYECARERKTEKFHSSDLPVGIIATLATCNELLLAKFQSCGGLTGIFWPLALSRSFLSQFHFYQIENSNCRQDATPFIRLQKS